MGEVAGVYPVIFTVESAGDASAGITAQGAITFTDTLPSNIARATRYEALAINGSDRGLFTKSLLGTTTLNNATKASLDFAQSIGLSTTTVSKAARGEHLKLSHTAAICCARRLGGWTLCVSLANAKEASLRIIEVNENYSYVVGAYLRALRKDSGKTLLSLGSRVKLDRTKLHDLEVGTARDPRFPKIERVFAQGFAVDVGLLAIRPHTSTDT